MKKLKLMVIPFSFLFVTPWVHRLVYENLMAANHDMNSGAAHFLALLMASISAGITAYILCL